MTSAALAVASSVPAPGSDPLAPAPVAPAAVASAPLASAAEASTLLAPAPASPESPAAAEDARDRRRGFTGGASGVSTAPLTSTAPLPAGPFPTASPSPDAAAVGVIPAVVRMRSTRSALRARAGGCAPMARAMACSSSRSLRSRTDLSRTDSLMAYLVLIGSGEGSYPDTNPAMSQLHEHHATWSTGLRQQAAGTDSTGKAVALRVRLDAAPVHDAWDPRFNPTGAERRLRSKGDAFAWALSPPLLGAGPRTIRSVNDGGVRVGGRCNDDASGGWGDRQHRWCSPYF